MSTMRLWEHLRQSHDEDPDDLMASVMSVLARNPRWTIEEALAQLHLCHHDGTADWEHDEEDDRPNAEQMAIDSLSLRLKAAKVKLFDNLNTAAYKLAINGQAEAQQSAMGQWGWHALVEVPPDTLGRPGGGPWWVWLTANNEGYVGTVMVGLDPDPIRKAWVEEFGEES